jgi:hypothetical protein
LYLLQKGIILLNAVTFVQGVNIKMVAASQEMSLFVSFQGTAYWSGVGMGQLREVL